MSVCKSVWIRIRILLCVLSDKFSSSENLLLDVEGESSATSWFLFKLPDGGELTDLLALGEDTGSDLIEKYFLSLKNKYSFACLFKNEKCTPCLPMCRRICKIQSFLLFRTICRHWWRLGRWRRGIGWLTDSWIHLIVIVWYIPGQIRRRDRRVATLLLTYRVISSWMSVLFFQYFIYVVWNNYTNIIYLNCDLHKTQTIKNRERK